MASNRRNAQAKRPPIRLGETLYPGLLQEARDLFWETLVRTVPEIEDIFKSDVFPKFLQLEDMILKDEVEEVYAGPGKWISVFATLNAVPSYDAFTEATTTWARQFNLDTLWIKDEALKRFLGLRVVKRAKRVKIHLKHVRGGLSLEFGPIDFDPYMETVAQFKDRAYRAFEQFAREWDEEISQAHPRSVELRERKHITWLVLYQVKGWSFHRIATVHNRDRKSVEDAVKKFASLIDLPLRPPAKGGRPRGSKDRGLRLRF